MPRCVLSIAFLVEGPFLTAGPGATGGLDHVFDRTAHGGLRVPRSHVQGKLREAVRRLAEVFGLPATTTDMLFGRGEADGDAVTASALVSDLRPRRADAPNATAPRADLAPTAATPAAAVATFRSLGGAEGADRIHRTAVGVSGSAKEHTLRCEESQPRGLAVWWAGQVEVQGPDRGYLLAVAALVAAAARCVEPLGMHKGVGSGVVRDVRCSATLASPGQPNGPVEMVQEADLPPLERAVGTLRGAPTVAEDAPGANPPATPAGARPAPQWWALTPLEPLYVAGVKIPGSQFQACLDHLPGSTIKGAIAAAINRSVGRRPDLAVRPGHPARATWPKLVAGLARLRVRHARASRFLDTAHGRAARGFVVPLSAYALGKRATGADAKVFDAVFRPPADGELPYFLPDCPELEQPAVAVGSAGTPVEFARIERTDRLRVAIDERTLAAKKSQLFGHEEIADADANGARPTLVFAVDYPFPLMLPALLTDEVKRLLPMVRAGKTMAACKIEPVVVAEEALERRVRAYGDRPLVLTLRTDAALDLPAFGPGDDLTPAYDHAWRVTFQRLGATLPEGAVARVFARQSLRGGWAGKRRRTEFKSTLVTTAGSVFVFSIAASRAWQEAAIQQALVRLEREGLPVSDEPDAWESTPYVPENGFGEVVACDAWHLARGAAGANA